MNTSVRRTIFLSSTTLLLCTALTGPALATETTPAASPSASASADDPVINTAPPEEPEESISEIPDDTAADPTDEPTDEPTYTGKPQPGESTNPADCSPAHGVYVPTDQGKQYHHGVGPTNSNYNGTSRTARSTFTSEVTGEVGVAISGDLETSVNTMLVKIKAKFNVTVSAKLTAKLGNSISVDTPAHTTTHAKYGVYRLKHTGKTYVVHQNCTSSPEHTVVSYSPYRVGWYLWES
ncbi:hypothetical protein [Streptomyces shenzhenensis]|uniref:hypothetical protein n=1 Tax=Streptomyces shenzhenensis TaxID=943815 RepID=UPI001F44348C|nr:hypothetical protein [Streptomyces shenzhenensis]